MDIVHVDDHPDSFKEGVRVLKLVSRNKDNAAKRKPLIRISQNPLEFFNCVEELVSLAQPGERVYASCDSRNVKKAMRLFRERQLASEYDPYPASFYFSLNNTWASCLDNPACANSSLFLFDLDTKELLNEFVDTTSSKGPPVIVDEYPTKNGYHVITEPFNPNMISVNLARTIHRNAVILWAYTK